MARAPHLVQSPRSRRVEGGAHLESPRECLASVHWQVHVPNHGQGIADTATAGADIELLSEAISAASESGHRYLLLTFWIDRGTPERPERDVLAAFTDDPASHPQPLGVDVQLAAFEFTNAGESLSVDIVAAKPLLRITQVSGSSEQLTMVWCQGIVHELLGLGGGQYRLDTIRIDRSLLSRVTSHVSLAREAG